MASMPSTVCAGSSSSVSRVPGPPPRTSTRGDRRLVEHDRGRAGAELGVVGMADRRPGTSVMQIAQCHAVADSITSGSRSGEGHDARACMNALRACASRAPWPADVTIFAALFAGLVSFLSPCVLPLVPPYLVYLAGTSLERFADAEPEPRVRRETVGAALPVRARLLDRVRRARRQRQRDRLADPRLFGARSRSSPASSSSSWACISSG